MIIILLSLASCEEKQNKKYQLDFGINNIKLSQTKDKSSYYLLKFPTCHFTGFRE